MTNYTVAYSKTFEKEIRKLSVTNQILVFKKVDLLEANPFYPSLRTKKLEGYIDLYESSVNMDIRLVWRFDDGKIILMLDVGHHDVLKKY